MTRIIKLIISLIYFIYLKIKEYLINIFKFELKPTCVVLYYHSIFENEREKFKKQVQLLAKSSNVISSNYIGKLENNKLYTIITFDDGFENLIENAIPILKEYKLPFTIFFVSSNFGKTPKWAYSDFHPDQNEKIMSIEQMNNLPNELVTIGSHTVHHKKLTSILEDELNFELKESKNNLEKLSNRTVDTISFPNGEYNNLVVQKSFEAGYKRVFTIEPMPALQKENEKISGRVWVNGDDWYLEFWLKLNGAYCWLNYIFELKSKIKGLFK